jgi:hypothetical protein
MTHESQPRPTAIGRMDLSAARMTDARRHRNTSGASAQRFDEQVKACKPAEGELGKLGALECSACGSLIVDPEQHVRWHDEIRKAVSEAAHARFSRILATGH